MQDSLGISRGQRKITLERREDKDILGTSRGAKNTIFFRWDFYPIFLEQESDHAAFRLDNHPLQNLEQQETIDISYGRKHQLRT